MKLQEAPARLALPAQAGSRRPCFVLGILELYVNNRVGLRKGGSSGDQRLLVPSPSPSAILSWLFTVCHLKTDLPPCNLGTRRFGNLRLRKTLRQIGAICLLVEQKDPTFPGLKTLAWVTVLELW